MHTSNYISISPKGKLGLTLLMDNFLLVQGGVNVSESHKGPRALSLLVHCKVDDHVS